MERMCIPLDFNSQLLFLYGQCLVYLFVRMGSFCIPFIRRKQNVTQESSKLMDASQF